MFFKALAKTLRGLFQVSAEGPAKPLARAEVLKLLGSAHEKSMQTHPDTTVFFDTTRHDARIHMFVNDRYTNICTAGTVQNGAYSHIEIFRNNHTFVHDIQTEKGRERFVAAAARNICETLSNGAAPKTLAHAGHDGPGGWH